MWRWLQAEGYLPSGLRGAMRGSPRPAEDNRSWVALFSLAGQHGGGLESTGCTWRHWRAGSVELTALTAGSTGTGCRHGQNSPCGTNIADDGWRKEQAGYSAANLSHCQSTGTCPTAQFSGHWRGLRLSSGGQSTAIAFLSTPGASCRVLGIIYVPAKRNGRQAPQGAYGPGGLKPCCSSRKHKDACFEYPRDPWPLNGRDPQQTSSAARSGPKANAGGCLLFA